MVGRSQFFGGITDRHIKQFLKKGLPCNIPGSSEDRIHGSFDQWRCFCGSILLLANGVGHHHVIKLSIKKKYSEKSRKYHDTDQRNGKFCLKA